jgi:hypothetical protein
MQLAELYSRLHRRYSSLPIFGSIIEGFAMWLWHQGYPRQRVRMHVRKVRIIASSNPLVHEHELGKPL